MSVNQRPQVAYGLSQPDFAAAPQPIISVRVPTTKDFAQIGTIWIDIVTNAAYILTSVTDNSANWLNI
jgi:hypothetical protein